MRPTVVFIAGVAWPVTSITRNEMIVEGNTPTSIGYSNGHNNTIRYLDALSPDRAASVIFHEIIHSVESEYGVGLDEKQVTALASGLFECMRNNKEFFRWLMEETGRAS